MTSLLWFFMQSQSDSSAHALEPVIEIHLRETSISAGLFTPTNRQAHMHTDVSSIKRAGILTSNCDGSGHRVVQKKHKCGAVYGLQNTNGMKSIKKKTKEMFQRYPRSHRIRQFWQIPEELIRSLNALWSHQLFLIIPCVINDQHAIHVLRLRVRVIILNICYRTK